MAGPRRSTVGLVCVVATVGLACFVVAMVSDGVLGDVAGLVGWACVFVVGGLSRDAG